MRDLKDRKNMMSDNLNLDHIAINVKENMDEAFKLFFLIRIHINSKRISFSWFNKSFNSFQK